MGPRCTQVEVDRCSSKSLLYQLIKNFAFGVDSTLFMRILMTGREAMAVDFGPGY